jgi:hypothetical protein
MPPFYFYTYIRAIIIIDNLFFSKKQANVNFITKKFVTAYKLMVKMIFYTTQPPKPPGRGLKGCKTEDFNFLIDLKVPLRGVGGKFD